MSRQDQKRDQLAAAAIGVFARYGYKRTSMDLLAQAASVSRPALYQHFSGKEAVFRAAGGLLLGQVTDAAAAAAAGDDPVADRLYRALAVKLELSTDLVGADQRQELIKEAAIVASDLLVAFAERLVAVIEAVLTSTDELDLVGTGFPASDTAALLCDAMTGIACSDASPETQRHRLRMLVTLTVRSLSRRPDLAVRPDKD